LFSLIGVNDASRILLWSNMRAKAGPLIGEWPGSDKIVYKEVKDCVVGGRNGTSHTRCALFRNAPCCEMAGVFQQFIS
jgi:hypothetical protein